MFLGSVAQKRVKIHLLNVTLFRAPENTLTDSSSDVTVFRGDASCLELIFPGQAAAITAELAHVMDIINAGWLICINEHS
jgi:hypothetical protein